MAYLSICCVYSKTCLTEEHVLLEGMCYSVTHVVMVVMSFMRMCYERSSVVDEHLLQVFAESATISDAVNLGKWCVLFSPVIFFCSETCFLRIYFLECSFTVLRVVVVFLVC